MSASDDNQHLPAAVFHRMTVAYDGLTSQWRRALSLNAHERLAIAHLWESGSMTMSELGERIPLSRAAVTSLTDRLEALGYVRRTPDPHDRRRTMLQLTDVPQQRLVPLSKMWSAALEEVRSQFDDAEWQAIQRFLDEARTRAHEEASRLRAMSDEELLELRGDVGAQAVTTRD